MIPVNRKNSFVLYLEDLPQDCMETDIIKLMQPYGRVNAVTIHRHHSGGHQARTSGVFATAEFQLREHAESVMNYLENNMVWGKKLKVQLLNPPGMNASAPVNNVNPKPMRSAQVHISYLSKQLNTMVSEQMIYELFSNFGKVLEVSLKKKCVDTEMCIQNGYGFVHYPLTSDGIDSALKAVESLHQVTINNVSYDCSISNQLRQVLFNTGRLLKKGPHAAASSSQPNLLSDNAINANPASRLNNTLPSSSNSISNTNMRMTTMDPAMSQAVSIQQQLPQQQMNSIQHNMLQQQQQLQFPLRQTASWSEGTSRNNNSNIRSMIQPQQQKSVAYQAHLNNNGANNNLQNFSRPSFPPAFVTSSTANPAVISSSQQQQQNPSVPLRYTHNLNNCNNSNLANIDFAKERDFSSNRNRSFYNNINNPQSLTMQHAQDVSSMAYSDDMANTVGTMSLGTSMDASSSWSDMKSVGGSSHSSLSSLLMPGTANGSFYLENYNNNNNQSLLSSTYASHNTSFSDASVASNNNGNNPANFYAINSNNVTSMRNNAAAIAALTGGVPPVSSVATTSPNLNNTTHYLSRSAVKAASFPTSLPSQSPPQHQRSPALSALNHPQEDLDLYQNKTMNNYQSKSAMFLTDNGNNNGLNMNNMHGLMMLKSDSSNSGASLDDLISLPTLETTSKEGFLSSLSSPNYDQQFLQKQQQQKQQMSQYGNSLMDSEIAWN